VPQLGGVGLRFAVEQHQPTVQVVGKHRQLNAGIYTALSHESHAHLLGDPASLRVAVDGAVSIVSQKVDEISRNKLVVGCISYR